MSLRDVFPLSYVHDKFEQEVVSTEHDLSTIDRVAHSDPQPVHQVGLLIWHQIICRGLFDVNPFSMAEYVDTQDPFLYRGIEDLLGIQAISDFYYANLRVHDESLSDDDECCQICLADVYPNTIVLSDIVFQNPYKPIPKKERRYRCTYYKGLSLLAIFMERLKSYSIEKDKDRILLTASFADLVPLFMKHGFEPDGSPIAEAGLQAGCGIPMHLLLQ